MTGHCKPYPSSCRRLALLLFFAAAWLAAGRSATASSSINSLEKIRLGGIDQWLLIRGRDRTKPVLLVLHGGPGMPIIPFFQELDKTSRLEENFVMVYWDQRGAGHSYDPGIPADSMTIEQFVSDAHDLTLSLIERFQTPKIYLLGHSWGTIIGVKSVTRWPELFQAYIGVGQVVSLSQNETLSYQFALSSARKYRHKEGLDELKAIGPPPYASYEGVMRQRHWSRLFSEKKLHSGSFLRNLMGAGARAPEQTELVFLDQAPPVWLEGPAFSLKHLWTELKQVDLVQEAPAIHVPVYFLEGRCDYIAPSVLAKDYFQKLQAPGGKALVWFEHSAHSPFADEPEKFAEVLVTTVLGGALPAATAD